VGAIGFLCVGAGSFVEPTRAWSAWLSAAFWALELSLGALAFLALTAATRAGWSTILTPVAELLTRYVPVGGVLVLLTFSALPQLYHWAHHGASEHDALLAAKSAWLNVPFFLGRAVFYVLLWWAFALGLRKRSALLHAAETLEDKRRIVRSNLVLSALFLILFSYSFAAASVDWVMSLEPHWTSTIFGMYHLSGVLLGGVAILTLTSIALAHVGLLPTLREDHLHDLGKLMFGLSTFWAYIWLSQYLLVWYANIPEESIYFVRRTTGGWAFLFWLDVAIGWAIPFLALLPRPAKRSEGSLIRVSALLIIARWLDVYLCVAPANAPRHPGIGLIEVGAALAVGAVFVLVTRRALGEARLLPSGDPFLGESLSHRQ